MWENAGGQGRIGFRWASDYLRTWCNFSEPTTEWSMAEQKQSWISNDTELKMTFSNVRQTSISSYRVDVTFTDDEC